MGLTIFQIGLTLSFLVTLAVVVRLFKGVQVLNARVGILSSLVRELRGRLDELEGKSPDVLRPAPSRSVDMASDVEGEVEDASEVAPVERDDLPLERELEAKERSLAQESSSYFSDSIPLEGTDMWAQERKLQKEAAYDFAYDPNSWSLLGGGASDGQESQALDAQARRLEEEAARDFGAAVVPDRRPKKRRRRVSASKIQEKSSAPTDVRSSSPSPLASGMMLRKLPKRSARGVVKDSVADGDGESS